MPSGFISDGYSLTETIEGVEHCFDSIDLTYRPMTPVEVTELREKLKNKKGIGIEKEASKVLAEHITGWTLVDQDDDEVSVTAENLLRLHPRLYSKVHQIIMGSFDWSAAEKN